MRVLHVISEMGAGGAETLVAGMVARGEEYGWVSAVACGGGFRADALAADGTPTFAVPLARRSEAGVLKAAWATRRAIARFRPDVVLAHNVGASLVTRLAGRRPITVFHGVADDVEKLAGRQLARVHRLDDHGAGLDAGIHVQAQPARAGAQRVDAFLE